MEKKFEELKEKIVPVLSPYGVKRIALFGSVARGEETPESDVDLLITLKPREQRPPLGLRWFGLERELGQILGREVEMVNESALKPRVRPYIERDLVILYDER